MTEIENDIDLSDVTSSPPNTPPKRCRVKRVRGVKLVGGKSKKGKIEPFIVKKPDIGMESIEMESESAPLGAISTSPAVSTHGPSNIKPCAKKRSAQTC